MKFEIPSAGIAVYLTLIGITLIAACIPLIWRRKDNFAVALKRSCLSVLLVAPITLGIAYTVNDNAFELDGKNISIRAAYFYKNTRSLSEFDLNSAQHGLYHEIPAAKLKWRQSGIGLPGVNMGYFSTDESLSIFAILTDRSQVLFLPAKSGTSLLVSVTNPIAVLEALKRAKSGS